MLKSGSILFHGTTLGKILHLFEVSLSLLVLLVLKAKVLLDLIVSQYLVPKGKEFRKTFLSLCVCFEIASGSIGRLIG